MSQNFPKVLAKSLYEEFTAGKSDKIVGWMKTQPSVKDSAEPIVRYLKACKNFDEFYTVLNGGTIDTPIKLSPSEMQAVSGGISKISQKGSKEVKATSKWPWE